MPWTTEKIEKEFSWLCAVFPVESPIEVSLRLHAVSKDAMSSFFEYERVPGGLRTTIWLLLEDTLSESECNERLYHEYGHLLDVATLYRDGGLTRIEQEMASYEAAVEELLAHDGTDGDRARAYADLPRERAANAWAKKMKETKEREVEKEGGTR